MSAVEEGINKISIGHQEQHHQQNFGGGGEPTLISNNNHNNASNKNSEHVNGVSDRGSAPIQNGTITKSESLPKVAKTSKKLSKAPRPALEIYRPPGLRRNHHATKSSEDLSTKPSAAGSKQPNFMNAFRDFKRTGFDQMSKNNSLSKSTNKLQQGKGHGSTGNLRQERTTTTTTNGRVGNNRRSVTPPPIFTNQQEKIKRSSSFVKDLPKKKGFTSKDVQEAKLLFMALEIANDDLISQWIAGNFESTEMANPVGQVLVQMAIEHAKPQKLVGKLCSLLIECTSGEQFHKGLVTSCYQYYECREKLRTEHFRFWLAFVNCLSELYANLGFTYEGELVEILFQIYDFLLKAPILDNLKIEELESLISSLLNVGYDLERQCPDKMSDLLSKLRDAFIAAHEPWVRKMILLLIELSASGWKLPAEANEYYFQTQSNSASG